MRYHSWELRSDIFAEKTMDKSVFVHHGISIPVHLREFFNMKRMKKGDRKDITLITGVAQFPAHIELGKQREYEGKAVKEESHLFWRSDFDKIIKEKYPILFDLFSENVKLKSKMRPILRFEKLNKRNSYYITFINPEEKFKERKMSWKDAVLTCIKELPNHVFTLQDLYKFEPEFQVLFPSNFRIKAKIRQQIPFLRDDGYIEFVDNRGTYRRLFENDVEFGYIKMITGQINRKDYRVDDDWKETKVRIGMNVFRKYVLKNFDYQCCICRFNLESLLEAHHIRPWRSDKYNRLNPLNGLSLCRIHHGAMDHNIMQVNEDYRIIVNKNLLKNENVSVKDFIVRYHNRKIVEPVEGGLML